MRHRVSRALLLVIAAAGVVAAAALTAAVGGGRTIASAPELPLGRTIASGWLNQKTHGRYGEYWRVGLAAGDRLIVDYGITQQSCTSIFDGGTQLRLDMYPPNITDFTVNEAISAYEDVTGDNGKHQAVWVATRTGRWTIEFHGCKSLSYEFRARVQHFTDVALRVPRLTPVNRRLSASGKVTGVRGGQVAITFAKRGAKTVASVVTLAADGSFEWGTTPKSPGTYRLQVVYYGDDTHRPSRASATVQVV